MKTKKEGHRTSQRYKKDLKSPSLFFFINPKSLISPKKTITKIFSSQLQETASLSHLPRTRSIERMHLATFIPFLALLASVASAGCYSGGETWKRPQTNWTPKAACKRLTGKTYTPGQSRAARLNIKGGFCNNFVLKNIGGSGRKIGIKECLDGFGKEFYGCSHGGDSSYTNWEYM